tara:strand:- start:517 stop:741 length:225 start_codon:yes stop_codon:yes gene_type:complete
MPLVKTPVNELSWKTRFEIESALRCMVGRKLKLLSVYHDDPDFVKDIDELKSAYKEFAGKEMDTESLKEIYLSE